MKRYIKLFEDFIYESGNDPIEISLYIDVVNNRGKETKSTDQKAIEKVLKDPDNFTDDMRFEDKQRRLYFIDDLIGKNVKVNGNTFVVQESVDEDELGDLLGGGDDKDKKPKEDPLEKKKKEAKKAEQKAKEKHEKFVDKKEDEIEGILNKLPEVKDKIGDKVRDAIKSQDRVKIHNVALDITYLQQDYQEHGDTEMVDRLSPLKDYIDDLDRSFTNDKMM